MLSAPPFSLLENLDRVDDAIDANAEISDAIFRTAASSFGFEGQSSKGAATPSDMDKARSTVRQMMRDWSAEGATERRACYDPVLGDLAREYSHVLDKRELKVLVPGAGLGRLVFELCQAGYNVEGNEISYHQLMASNLILNHTVEAEQFDLYPFALEFSNVERREDQLKKVKVPDVHPGSTVGVEVGDAAANRMSMSAADFVVLYSQERYRGTFDSVVTVFFIDTAPNLIRYIETIRNCLKDGGVWINLGPLLWHFSDRAPGEHNSSRISKRMGEAPGIEEPGSFELSNEEVLCLVEKLGFGLESQEIRNDGTGYIQNPNCMLQNAYRTSHWIARKLP
ncbi:hypothetical protein MMC21_004914 [Puttea exsequens]|nr:hypothetical protein [Puttea exsequens]